MRNLDMINEPSDWLYSRSLEMKFRMRQTDKGIRVQTEDRVVYSEDEITILLLQKALTKEIHNIKKTLGGEITEENINGVDNASEA
jgi:hypothetical protein